MGGACRRFLAPRAGLGAGRRDACSGGKRWRSQPVRSDEESTSSRMDGRQDTLAVALLAATAPLRCAALGLAKVATDPHPRCAVRDFYDVARDCHLEVERYHALGKRALFLVVLDVLHRDVRDPPRGTTVCPNSRDRGPGPRIRWRIAGPHGGQDADTARAAIVRESREMLDRAQGVEPRRGATRNSGLRAVWHLYMVRGRETPRVGVEMNKCPQCREDRRGHASRLALHGPHRRGHHHETFRHGTLITGGLLKFKGLSFFFERSARPEPCAARGVRLDLQVKIKDLWVIANFAPVDALGDRSHLERENSSYAEEGSLDYILARDLSCRGASGMTDDEESGTTRLLSRRASKRRSANAFERKKETRSHRAGGERVGSGGASVQRCRPMKRTRWAGSR